MDSKNIHPGSLHLIPRPKPSTQPLIAFEHSPPTQPPSQSNNTNTLLFLPGLFDNLLSVPYIPSLAPALPSSWTLIEPLLSCSAKQAGFSSLTQDVSEIADIVSYFNKLKPGGKIVLLGHSTGCQQAMTYLLSLRELGLEAVDGAIMQASVSDREVMSLMLDPIQYKDSCALAKSFIDEGRGDDILPFSATNALFQTNPISAKRWLSLASPGPEHAGADDLFSSDFDDERLGKTFGALGKTGCPLAFLFSGEDQYVPATVDKEKLMGRWHTHVRNGGGIVDGRSGIVDGASHTLEEGGEAVKELVGRVVGFLDRVDKAV